MSLLKKIEQTFDKRLRALFGGNPDRPGAREAVELYRDALDQISRHITPGRRGERIFPFDRISIELRAADNERKAILQTVFEPNQLLEDIRAALAEDRTTPPANLTVAVHYPPDATTDLRILCEKTPSPEQSEPAAPPPEHAFAAMWLITLAGVSSSPEFFVDRPQINLGRVRDVIDAQGRPLRRNDLHFPEGMDDANATVSRSHAHVRFDPATGEWRIFDDGSSLGTAVFRDGHRFDVPAHSPRGAMLRPGDEICLGQARLLFAAPR